MGFDNASSPRGAMDWVARVVAKNLWVLGTASVGEWVSKRRPGAEAFQPPRDRKHCLRGDEILHVGPPCIRRLMPLRRVNDPWCEQVLKQLGVSRVSGELYRTVSNLLSRS